MNKWVCWLLHGHVKTACFQEVRLLMSANMISKLCTLHSKVGPTFLDQGQIPHGIWNRVRNKQAVLHKVSIAKCSVVKDKLKHATRPYFKLKLTWNNNLVVYLIWNNLILLNLNFSSKTRPYINFIQQAGSVGKPLSHWFKSPPQTWY